MEKIKKTVDGQFYLQVANDKTKMWEDKALINILHYQDQMFLSAASDKSFCVYYTDEEYVVSKSVIPTISYEGKNSFLLVIDDEENLGAIIDVVDIIYKDREGHFSYQSFCREDIKVYKDSLCINDNNIVIVYSFAEDEVVVKLSPELIDLFVNEEWEACNEEVCYRIVIKEDNPENVEVYKRFFCEDDLEQTEEFVGNLDVVMKIEQEGKASSYFLNNCGTVTLLVRDETEEGLFLIEKPFFEVSSHEDKKNYLMTFCFDNELGYEEILVCYSKDGDITTKSVSKDAISYDKEDLGIIVEKTKFVKADGKLYCIDLDA